MHTAFANAFMMLGALLALAAFAMVGKVLWDCRSVSREHDDEQNL